LTDSRVLVVDDTNFEALVLASKEPALLDFTAAWCSPCKVIAPILETLAHEHAGTFKVGTRSAGGSVRAARARSWRSWVDRRVLPWTSAAHRPCATCAIDRLTKFI
jgi:thiol-disulfide isomerase/thioredoxin